MSASLAFSVALIALLYLNDATVWCSKCGIRQDKTRSLITSAYDVQPGDYPWHTAIYQEVPIRLYICGGTLVGQSVVITSAHCVTVPGLRTARAIDELVVKVGKHLLDVEGDHEHERGLSSIIIHNEFSSDKHDNDIALLITKEPVQYGKFVQPACLPVFSLTSDNIVGTIVGWGFTEKKNISNALKAANAPIVSRAACIASNQAVFATTLTNMMFCAGYRNGTNACNGDSGGGLFRNVRGSWYLLGIISFTAARQENENLCSATDYTAYIDVVKYKRWIKENSVSSFGSPCLDSRPQTNFKKQYFVHNNKEVTFLEAWRQCQSVGHRLATITSEEDSRLLEQAIAKSTNTKGPWYIGGTDLGNEGHFIWISTNKPIGYISGYFNYSPGQPDNAGGNEHCLEIGRWGGVVWNDVPCEWRQRYICEYVSQY
ncbi:clotting factor G beta subunit-like [Armigeres subalbatus]|uniref:clotting factor G beta subunit-like n=1 Tax=Armigeres subalbatus TaxID=124917 RepID=UPI002ECFC64C